MNIDRRKFLQKGLAVGATVTFLASAKLLGEDTAKSATGDKVPAKNPDLGAGDKKSVLVAVRDGDRVTMLNRAMDALGGMGVFVKKGQTVLIKPNAGWDVTPECAANTHPDIVGQLVKLCFLAGAKEVKIFDHTCDNWQRAYANSGIEKAARDAGATLVNGNDESMYHEVEIPGAVKLKKTRVHELVMKCDVFINAPVLKHHGGATMTSCMKNLMGCTWDRGFYHQNDLHQCIADFLLYKKPALNIVDAYHPMVRNGPRGKGVEDVVEMKTLLASTDIVVADAAAAKLLGHKPEAIRHVSIASAMGLGSMDLENIAIQRIKIA
ncbi:MAG: DUF362 domain-containing protein [Verrucomicrobiota bacterium]|nr:DUF362 domain-containing protein [Verrucomicrobiota bacterium]